MHLDELALKAGFYTNDSNVYSPVRKERITKPLLALLKIVEQELLNEIEKERNPSNVNYNVRSRYSDLITTTMAKLRS